MSLRRRALWTGRLLDLSYYLQLVILTLGTWVWHQEGRVPSLTIWVIRMLPLLIFLPGLMKRNLRTIVWLCFVVLLYFAAAVTEAMSPLGFWLNYIELANVVILFTSGMLFIRWHARAQRAE